MEDFGKGSSQTIQYHSCTRIICHGLFPVFCLLLALPKRKECSKKSIRGRESHESATRIFDDFCMTIGCLGSQNRVSAACFFHEPWTDTRICLPYCCDHEDVQLLFWCYMSVSNKRCFASKLHSVLSGLAEKYISHTLMSSSFRGSAVWFCQTSGWINLEASPKKSMLMKSLGNLSSLNLKSFGSFQNIWPTCKWLLKSVAYLVNARKWYPFVQKILPVEDGDRL